MAAATPAAPRPPRTQLQFTWNAPAWSEDRPAQYAAPRPIVIEKLKPPEGGRPPDPRAGDELGLGSSVAFSVVSQEKLSRAVQLAKRDVRRRHLEGHVVGQRLSGGGEGPAPCPQGREPGGAPRARNPPGARPKQEGPPGHAGKAEATGSRAKVFLHLPTQDQGQPPLPDSPPTHDPGLMPVSALQKEADRSSLEVRRLQKELQSYMQKVGELARRERSELALDPDEERRARVRRQEQVVRSARTLYVLQQQVKEIEEELEKLSPHKIKHTKKSRARARLAAAHRGAVRALQAFVAPFAGQPQPPTLLPPSATQFRQLGHLLRQLSLCSARLEMDSSVPDVVVDLLLQIEDLDTLLARQASPRERPGRLWGPPGDPVKGPARRPQKEKAVAISELKKPAAARKLLPDKPPESEETLPQDEANSAGVSVGLQGGLPPPQAEAVGQRDTENAAVGPGHDHPRRKGGVSFPTKPQGGGRPPRAKGVQPLAKEARFQEPTVSFRLKETKPPVRESRTPWMPPSLASPLSSPPRCPERSPPSKELALQRGEMGEGKQAPPRKEEEARVAGGSPTPTTARAAERSVGQPVEPLFVQAQKVNLSLDGARAGQEETSGGLPLLQPLPQREGECPSAAAAAGLLGGRLGTASAGEMPGRTLEVGALLAPGLPDLEAMLQSMEEMERFQDVVRRRYHQVVYSDTEFGAREETKERGWGAPLGDSGIPPSPIQVTRLVSRREAQAAILLGRPLDADAVEEEEEGGPSREPLGPRAERSPAQQPPAQRRGGAFLSLPPSSLQSIRDYRSRFQQHLRHLSHEPVGSFDPWHVTQSLAEELLGEALEEVAAELQGLCEDYAEAVFTSEFLRAPE